MNPISSRVLLFIICTKAGFMLQTSNAAMAMVGGIDPPPTPIPVPDPPTPVDPPVPVPDPGDYQDPTDPSTWEGIPSNISDDLAEDCLTCIIRAFGNDITNPND